MIQKFFEKNFFAQKVSKWSNSKSYHVKSEIWRPSNFFYYQAILVFIENGQNAVQRSLYLENSYENTIKGTAITTITATISFQFNFKYNSSHYLSSGVQGSSLVLSPNSFLGLPPESLWNQHRQSVRLSVTKVLILPTIRFFWFFAWS
jgi:hypothetical protein